MASAGIDELLDTNTTTSAEVSGGRMAQPGSRAQNTRVVAQVLPSANVDYSVVLEAAVNTLRGPKFETIGTFDQDDDSSITSFPIALGCLYRFRHISGGECRVLLTG